MIDFELARCIGGLALQQRQQGFRQIGQGFAAHGAILADIGARRPDGTGRDDVAAVAACIDASPQLAGAAWQAGIAKIEVAAAAGRANVRDALPKAGKPKGGERCFAQRLAGGFVGIEVNDKQAGNVAGGQPHKRFRVSAPHGRNAPGSLLASSKPWGVNGRLSGPHGKTG
ncbi:MAG: hypothetical protein R3D84_15540 [Paracoccaceae bacterium]